MNELETWEKIERLYENSGVSRDPNRDLGETCLMYAVLDASQNLYSGGGLLARMQRAIGRKIDVVTYNDSHTKEENLALIRQCRSECAAEQSGKREITSKAAQGRDLGIPGPQDTVRDYIGERRESVTSR